MRKMLKVWVENGKVLKFEAKRGLTLENLIAIGNYFLESASELTERIQLPSSCKKKAKVSKGRPPQPKVFQVFTHRFRGE